MRGSAPETPSASEVINRLRQLLGAATDLELAEKMGIGRTAPSNWRNRNSIPYELVAEVAKRERVSLDWLIFGQALPLPEGVAGETEPRVETPKLSPEAARISQFVEFWDSTRPHTEMVWLEVQLRRTVPEYAEWAPGGNG
jgi:Bacteriophage CI repressor helix-turn-helix domain.